MTCAITVLCLVSVQYEEYLTVVPRENLSLHLAMVSKSAVIISEYLILVGSKVRIKSVSCVLSILIRVLVFHNKINLVTHFL
jgi:hypothetical protein